MKKRKSITIAQWEQRNLLYLPLYVALHGGHARRLGLEVHLDFVGNDDAVFTAVATGRADFGIGDPVFAAFDRRAVCAGLLVKRAAIWGLTHNPAIRALKRLEDFVHLRIGSTPRPSTTYILIHGLKRDNRRLLKGMRIVEAPIGQQQALLAAGKADVALELEPMVSLAETYGLRPVFSLAQFYGDSAFTGLTQRTDQDPEVSRRVLKALQRGIDICRTDADAALRAAARTFPDYPSAVLKKAYRRMVRAEVWPETTAVDPDLWRRAVRLREAGVLA